MKKTILRIAGLAAAALFLAGCGENSDKDGELDRFLDVMNETPRTLTVAVSTDAKPNDASGGSVNPKPGAHVYKHGSEAAITATPKDGYRFSGWSGGSTSMANTVKHTMTGDYALTANFMSLSYKLQIYYNSDNGAVNVNGTPFASGAERTLPYGMNTLTAAANDEYLFTGWYTSPTYHIDSLKSAEPVWQLTMDGAMTLYARFQKESEVTYSLITHVSPPNYLTAGYVSVSRAPEKTEYSPGDTVTLTAAVLNESYRFVGWYDSLAGGYKSNELTIGLRMNSHVKLTAVFEPAGQADKYTVAYNVNGARDANGNLVTAPASKSANPGANITIDSIGGAGYPFVFRYWTTNSDGSGNRYNARQSYTSYSTGAVLTLYAKWDSAYIITFNANGGTGTPPAEQRQVADTAITLPGAGGLTRSGHTFIGWGGSPAGSDVTHAAGGAFLAARNDTLYAQWAASSVSLDADMVEVSGGTFTMSESGTEETVEDFSISKYEVTQKLWRDVMGGNPSKFKGDNLPVESVSWDEVMEFIAALNAKDPGKNYRLPTEAEWEFAARGGTQSHDYAYSGSGTIGGVAWYVTNSEDKTHNVGGKTANELGLFDMSGNVWEWVYDASGLQTGARVTRGGGYGDPARNCAVSRRSYGGQGYRGGDLGFRLAKGENATVGGGTTFNDSRDGKTYKKVTIGSQTWMAQNLNYEAGGSVCYNSSADSCAKYGRLYNWSTAMNGASSSNTSPSGVRGVCPVGWHLPSDAEWTALTDFVGGSSIAGTKLKSTTGWYYNYGTDDYEFAALPGGYGYSGGNFDDAGGYGYWWCAAESDASYAWGRYMYYNSEVVYRYDDVKSNLFSVRCVED